ncbi:MAG TPA: hypothetical protein VKM93_22345 [Terriglobia bacterium]|nr:hypothetical protein [Terriglobia bacterium]
MKVKWHPALKARLRERWSMGLPSGESTQLLAKARNGRPEGAAALAPLVYDELRHILAGYARARLPRKCGGAQRTISLGLPLLSLPRHRAVAGAEEQALERLSQHDLRRATLLSGGLSASARRR